MKRLILIKYGELTTKKANRNSFINLLEKNIKNVIDCKIKKDRVRMYIESEDIELSAIKLTKIFGIHGIVICYQVNNIKEELLELLKDQKFDTFKVETKRADKTFPIKSMDYNDEIGSLVLKNFNCKVDVHNPELTIHIEIRPEGNFIYFNEIKGLGGYPVGIQGKGLLMLSGGIDSPVAGYLSIKRGISLECLYFESLPHTSIEARNKVIKLASILNEYSGNIRVHIVSLTQLQEAIYTNIPNDYMITMLRRMMYRISEKVAIKNKCKIIINGESIGQVASQTLDSIATINSVTNFPIIRPVACFDKLEIIEIAKKINTYETSIIPFIDCCTVFVPKHPVIKPNINKCIEYEKIFDYNSMIDEAVNNIITIDNFKQNENIEYL